MGFLQEFLPESLALKIAVLAPAGLLILLLVNSFASERKIRALGGHAPIRKGWAPLGLDLLYGALKYNIAHRADEFFAIGFKMTKRANPWTYEMGIGHMRLIMTADPDNIKAILASQFADYGKGKQFYHDFEPFLGDSIFATDGQKWQNSRQMIRPQFVRDRLSDLVKFEHHIQKLLPMLGGKGQTVDIQTMFYCYTLDAATDFLLGKSIDSLGNEQAQFKIAFDDVQYVQSLIVRSGGFGWAIPKSKYYSGLKTVNEFTDTYIDAALRLPAGEIEKSANDNREHTFLHEAISYSRDRKVLRDQIIGILLAGRDTTAGTLSWFFYEISIKPKIVAKLRQEIIDTIGLDKSPTYEDLKSMKYLQVSH
jgi:cytochrome P450